MAPKWDVYPYTIFHTVRQFSSHFCGICAFLCEMSYFLGIQSTFTLPPPPSIPVACLVDEGTYAGNDSIVAFARNHGVTVVIHQVTTSMGREGETIVNALESCSFYVV